MNNIVAGKKASYLLYEELINKRDRYKKDAFQYERGYVREFGELILAVFNKKIERVLEQHQTVLMFIYNNKYNYSFSFI